MLNNGVRKDNKSVHEFYNAVLYLESPSRPMEFAELMWNESFDSGQGAFSLTDRDGEPAIRAFRRGGFHDTRSKCRAGRRPEIGGCIFEISPRLSTTT